MELGKFVDDELFPAMWDNLNVLFPEMGFQLVLGKWRSHKNMDGSDPTNHRADKTVVTPKLFQVALENGGGDAKGRAKNLITLYQEHNNIPDRIEAIKQIAQKCNLTIPEGADAKKWEEAQERREQLTLSYNRQKEALFSPEGAEVLRYLKEVRGYSEDLIKEMGLGYISPAESKTLEEKCKVGIAWRVEDYPLSIAYYSRGNVMGFKFRYITSLEGKPKYMNTRSLGAEGMDRNPFGLTPQRLNKGNTKGEVVVVEGELDALHAIALGLPNVIAVAGGKITEGKAIALKKNGYRNVVILLDTDIAGQKFTAESIRTIDQVGLNSFVASLPDAKDTDEYLQSHSIDELKEVISNAQFGGLFLYLKEREKYLNTKQTEIDFFNFLDQYYKIASGYNDPVKREILLTYLRKDFPEADIESIEKGIKERIELQIAKEEYIRKREQAAYALREASSSLTKGDNKKASFLTQKALESLKESEKDKSFSSILEDNTDEIWRKYREISGGLNTYITLKYKEGRETTEYNLYFPPGAISIVGAQTGHGKSKILISMAINNLEKLEEGETLLYISYEENELLVNKQFLNAYVNLYVKPKGKKNSNLAAISDYLSSGNPEELNPDNREAFLKKEEEWKKIRRSRKILIVKPDDNYLETLLDLITFAIKHLKVKAVFIDYVQEIYVRDWNKYSRTDELKEAMVQLDLLAQRTNLPFIMAAQLNREANSPLALFNRFIADSAWIERKASEILLIYSNAKKIEGEDSKTVMKRIKDEIENDLGTFEIPSSGKIYVRLTKSRIIPAGSHAIIPISGSTGRVGDNKQSSEPRQRALFENGGSPLSTYQNTHYDDNAKIDAEAQRPYRVEKNKDDVEVPF